MTKKNRFPDDIFKEYTQDVQNIFQDSLVSIVLYGSGARGDYHHKISDINILIVVTPEGMDKLSDSFSFVKKWSKKRNVSVPLFLTREYIQTSLDVFPIEFLNLKQWNKIIYGQDVLSDLDISDSDLRLKCEEQIKSKLLHLREGFLQTLGKKRRIERLMTETVPTLASIFTGLLILKKETVPESKMDIYKRVAHVFQLDETVFQQVIDVRQTLKKLSKDECISLLNNYIKEVEKLTNIVDMWQN